jgi:lipopolysaccharide export system protein LptC
MKRWHILVAAAAVLLLIAWGLHETGWISGEQVRPNQMRTADPMDTQAGWRYRQNLPHHWRYIMLRN